MVLKIGIESVNYPDSEDINIFVLFPGNSILKFCLILEIAWVAEKAKDKVNIISFIDQNHKHKKIYTVADFERETPTHKAATHAISKIRQNFFSF